MFGKKPVTRPMPAGSCKDAVEREVIKAWGGHERIPCRKVRHTIMCMRKNAQHRGKHRNGKLEWRPNTKTVFNN